MKKLLFPALLALAFYYAFFGGEHDWFELRAARSEVAAESARAAELRRTIDSLRARVDSLENDPATLERIARERYGMIREGEILYRFVEPGDSGDSGVEEASGG